jgi:alkylated DNA repair dioxygenase AlkB
MSAHVRQDELFTTTSLLPGFLYEPEFVDRAEEAELVRLIQSLPLEAARYREFLARRRIVSFGASYDFSSRELRVAGAIPPALYPLRARLAGLMGVPPEAIHHALVAEYQPGAPLGWHRDVPEFDVVGGLSLLGRARMRLRPYPHRKGDRTALRIDLMPRSAYVLRGPARWNWQHSISATTELRYSITLRTLRA